MGFKEECFADGTGTNLAARERLAEELELVKRAGIDEGALLDEICKEGRQLLRERPGKSVGLRRVEGCPAGWGETFGCRLPPAWEESEILLGAKPASMAR